MAYLIRDITQEKPQSGFRYLVDANIWLAVLESVFYHRAFDPYIDFFESIVGNKIVKDAAIVIPSVLLSEILNRLIRDVYYAEFKVKNTPLPGERNHFKNVYRSNPQYAIDMENACASLRAYHSKIQFVSDNIDQYSCKDLIKKIPSYLDINDYLYGKMALEQGLVIVTNDSDFKIEDVTILTSQKPLLNLMKS